MNRYLVNFHVMMNDKKIEAIKDVRAATGMGLGDAKRFCETFIPNSMDSTGGFLIANGEQVARLTELDVNSRGAPIFGTTRRPTYAIVSIKRIEAPDAIDISSNSVY